MRKLLVKIFNLIYLAGAVVAIVMFCTQPVVKTAIKLDLPAEKIASVLADLGKTGESGDGSGLVYSSRAYTFEESSESEPSFSDMLTEEKIKEAFKDGLHLEISVAIEAKDAFNSKTNKTILATSIVKSINTTVSNVISSVTQPLTNLIKSIAKDYAKEVMTDQINEALKDYFATEDTEIDPEQVGALFDNVYNKLDSDEPVSVQDLADAILGPKDEEGNYAEGGVYDILNTMQEEGKIDLPEDKTLEELVESQSLTDTMTEALETIPDLVYYEYEVANPQPTSETFAPDTYYIHRGGEIYDLESVFNQSYADQGLYLTRKTMVNNIDTALASLLSTFLEQQNGESNNENSGEGARAAIRTRAGEGGEKSTEEQLTEAVTALVYKFIPLETITEMTAQIDQYAGIAILVLIGLFSFPWALFALVTLIRTLRKEKIWTKPWIVFFFAFLQLIFGLVLTYGLKYATTAAEGYIPEDMGQVKDLIDYITLDVRTGCLVPSFIYLAFIPLTIAYIIICHPVKVEYKLKKRELRLARKGK